MAINNNLHNTCGNIILIYQTDCPSVISAQLALGSSFSCT